MSTGMEATKIRRGRLATALLATVLAAIAVFLTLTGESDAPPRPSVPAEMVEAGAPVVPERRHVGRDSADDAGADSEIPADRTMIVVTSEADGAPVAGAFVFLQHAGVGLTDSRGIAMVQRPDTWPVDVTVRASGFASHPSAVQIPDGALARISIRLQPATTLHVLVVDAETGTPVQHADVAFHDAGSGGLDAIENVRTGATGAVAVVDAFGAGDDVLVCVRHSEYAMSSIRVTVPELPGEPLRVELERGEALTGTVLTHDGKPARAATVRVTDVDLADALETPMQDADRVGSRPWQQSRSGSDGRFNVRGLRADTTYLAVAVGKDGRMSARSPPFGLESPASEIRLVLPPDGSLVIRVLTDDRTTPPGTRVEWMRPMVSRRRTAELVDDRFVLSGLPPGQVHVRVTAPGHAEVNDVALVTAGARTEHTIRLERGQVMSGIVIDDRGSPVSDARVAVRGEAAAGSAQTDGDGRFRLCGLDAGDARVSVTARDHIRSASKVTLPAADLTLRLSRHGILAVRLCAPATGPVPKTRLRAGRYIGSGDPDPLGAGRDWQHWPGFVTFEDGVANVRVKTVGPSRLIIFPKGFAPIFRTASVEPGRTVDLGEIVISRGRMVSGHVRDDAGRPVAGAKVEAEQNLTWQRVATESDAGGAFTVDRLVDAPVDVTVTKAGYSGVFVELDGPTSGVALTMNRDRSVAITVIDGRGGPVSGGAVSCVPAFAPGRSRTGWSKRLSDPPRLQEAADHPGRYEGRVSTGTWRIVVNDEFVENAEIEVTTGEDTAHFEIRVE